MNNHYTIFDDGVEEMAEDVSNFNGLSTSEVADRFLDALFGTGESMRYLGVVLDNAATEKFLRPIGQKANHGRCKKISVKRPSPRVSRKQIAAYKARARLSVIKRQVCNDR